MSARVSTDVRESGGSGSIGSTQPNSAHVPPSSFRKTSQSDWRTLIYQIKQEHPLLEVFSRFGIGMKKRGEWMEGNCPYRMNHTDDSPSFKVRLRAPERFHCFGCNASGDIFTLARDLYGQTTFADQVLYVTGRTLKDWAAGLPANEEEREQFVRRCEAERQRLETARRMEEEKWRSVPDERAGPVYEALIERLGFEEEERAEMEARGMSAEIAYQCGYRTFPSEREARVRVCEELIEAGFRLKKVPGFFRLPSKAPLGGRWCIGGTPWGGRDYTDEIEDRVWEVRGLLVPLCDEQGRVVQLKVRNANMPGDLPERFRKYWPPKYMVIGSEKRMQGATPPVKAHFAGPRTGGRFPGVLWVTEGEIKADIAALYLHGRFCGLPGVSQCPQLAISAALAGGYKEVRIAMDAEVEKLNVQKAIAVLCREAVNAGLKPSVAVWDGSAQWKRGLTKGIDDLCAAGGEFTLLSHSDWWASLDSEMRAEIERQLQERGGIRLAPVDKVEG